MWGRLLTQCHSFFREAVDFGKSWVMELDISSAVSYILVDGSDHWTFGFSSAIVWWMDLIKSQRPK
jgi:hypothetical protein